MESGTSGRVETNPITADQVRREAAKLGLTVKDEEVEAYRDLLSAARETYEELSALPDYNLPLDPLRRPPQDVRKVGTDSNEHGNAWSYKFDLINDPVPQTSVSADQLLLAGKNIVVKDNVCVAGVPQVHGTDAIEPWIPKSDAIVVTRILQAGGRIVGTAVCEALSCTTVSNTSCSGPIHNPWAKGYSAGGSSSGVGALIGDPGHRSNSDKSNDSGRRDPVKIDMGIGADQGGSIRIPAAFCGLYGLKATHGLIPYTGVSASEAVLDHVGPMCRSVWDIALLLEVIAGADGIDDRQVGAQAHRSIRYSSNLKRWYDIVQNETPRRPLNGRKIAILTEAIEAPYVSSQMRAEIRKTAEIFKGLGAIVDEIPMPLHKKGHAIWLAVCRQSLTSIALGNPMGRRSFYLTGFLENLLPWTQEKWDRLPAVMRNELLSGLYEQENYPHLYAKCMNLGLEMSRAYETVFKTYDILLLPTVPFTAPRLYDRNKATAWESIDSTSGLGLNTVQFNLTGHPALSVPISVVPDMSGDDSSVRLPVAAQLVGPLHGEQKILEFAYALEQSYDWTSEIR